MSERTLHDIQSERRALQAKLNRTGDEFDQLKTRTDAGGTERAANLRTALDRGAERLSELVLEERDVVHRKMTTGTVGYEAGDGATDVAAVSVKTSTKPFGAEPTPWLPGIGEYRKLQVKAIGTAGAFVPVQYASSFFDLLRRKTAVLAASPIMLPVAGAGSVKVPRVTSSVTIAGVAENTAITPADAGLGELTLDPLKFAALTLVAREALEDSAPQLRDVVATTLLADLSVELDKQLVTGSGAAGQLRGLRNIVGTTAGPTLGTNGASLSFAHLADTAAALENANGDMDSAAWLMHSRTWGSVRKLVDTAGRPLVATDPTAGISRTLFGRPVCISNSLAINETTGTSTDTSTLILADMTQVIVAVSRDLEVLMSEHYAFDADQIAVKATCRYDIGSPNPAGIVLTTGVRP